MHKAFLIDISGSYKLPIISATLMLTHIVERQGCCGSEDPGSHLHCILTEVSVVA